MSGDGEQATDNAKGGGKGKLLLLGLVVVALFAAFKFLPVAEWLDQALGAIKDLGPWGPVALVGIYILACVLLVPGSVLTLGAGAVFGVVTGTVAVFIGATLGATAAFLVGRYVARRQVEQKVAGNARFAAIDKAVGREGLKIVFLTRLSPIFPFSLLNYGYGLTSVSLKDYFFGSVGMLPGTLMYVYLGHAGKAAAGAATGEGKSPAELALLGVGLLATIVVTVFVTKIARKALDEAVGGVPEAAGEASNRSQEA